MTTYSRILVVAAFLLFSLPPSSHGGDLGMAGAISGAGQGMQQGLATMQSTLAQQALMEQQFKQQMERDRQELARQAALNQQRRDQEMAALQRDIALRKQQSEKHLAIFQDRKSVLAVYKGIIERMPDSPIKQESWKMYDEKVDAHNAMVDGKVPVTAMTSVAIAEEAAWFGALHKAAHVWAEQHPSK